MTTGSAARISRWLIPAVAAASLALLLTAAAMLSITAETAQAQGTLPALDAGAAPRTDAFQAEAAMLAIASNKHMGVASCATSVCHGKLAPQTDRNVALNEYRIWHQDDRHAQAYRTLQLPASKRIAENLGLPSASTAKICLDCHTDNVPASQRGPKFQISDGVGCESCHGGAERWLESHAVSTATHQENVARGMYPTEQPLERVRLCLSCHLGTRDRFATHAIMAAGHPRLSFELEAYTANQPAHFVVDDDYRRRKGVIEGMNLWLGGQLESARRYLTLMQGPRFNGSGLFPELAFYDCHSCHHPMDEIRWNEQRAAAGIQPGTVRLQTHNLIVLQAVAETFQPGDKDELQKLTHALLRAGETQRVTAGEAARDLLDWLAPREALVMRSYTPNDIRRMRQALIRYAANDQAGDYATAEQVVLALESLSYSLGDRDERKQALDALYDALKDESGFSPQRFRSIASGVRQSF